MPIHQSRKIVNLAGLKVACKDCNLRELCLPLGLSEQDMTLLDNVIKRHPAIRKGQTLYRAGDPLRALYAVRRGMFKSAAVTEDGRVHVTGFFMPSEILGFDSITTDRHHCTAEALETSEVCEIPFDRLEELSRSIPGLQHQVLKIMSREIQDDEKMLVMLGRMTAEERLATFLVSFSRRQARLGLSDTDLNLVMSRQDMGHYLGLALETVSRLLSRFQEQGLLEILGRQVRLLDPARIDAMARGRTASVVDRRER